MKLSFDRPYLSITSFNEIELPNFTLITGINGSGKTHLLDAIRKEHIKVDVVPNPKQGEIRTYNWINLVPSDTGTFQTASIYSQRDAILQWTEQACMAQREELHRWKSIHGLANTYQGPDTSLFCLTKENLDTLVTDPTKSDRSWRHLENIRNVTMRQIFQNAGNDANTKEKLEQLKLTYGNSLPAITNTDFETDDFNWGQVDIFEQSFAQLFLTYYEQKRMNMLRRIDETEGRPPPVPAMTDEEFLRTHGEPPWDFVNRILANVDLDFEIDYPIGHSITKFTPHLRKKSSGIDLKFSELSSGERILISFAFCLYYSIDARQEVRRPKMLLLDEIDAPLHPSMSRQILNTIQKSLVEEQEINVIMTTHSPSTVAVAPEEFIYLMPSPTSGLKKVGKRQAISTLTSEIPTLSIDFCGRRQVFVESQNDAERYEKLYRLTSPMLESERSLAFIAVGRKKEQGTADSGCDQVKRIVRELVGFGNDSVFGLIDWDMHNNGDDRVIVLAKNARYAIENCLLDPLLVAALLVRTNRSWGEKIGLSSTRGYSDLASLTPQERQAVVDNIERRVLATSDEDPFGDRESVQYVGGFSANVSTAYLTMQGHYLEDKVKEALPSLKQYKNAGQILMNVIDSVLFDLRQLLPVDVPDAFRAILDYDGGNLI